MWCVMLNEIQDGVQVSYSGKRLSKRITKERYSTTILSKLSKGLLQQEKAMRYEQVFGQSDSGSSGQI